MATKKKKAGRPEAKDKRIRVSFMTNESTYNKAVKNLGESNLKIYLELKLSEKAL